MGVLNLQVTVGERTGATVSLSPRGMVTRGTLHFLFSTGDEREVQCPGDC